MVRSILPERSSDGGSARLEAFSDAILAIAITLLVIEIRIPSTSGAHLGAALRHLWPSYLAYGLSFTTIGFVWVAHHSMFRRIRDVDRLLLILNLGLMLCVAFLPFSTAVLARYSFTESSGAAPAAELYSINMLVIGLAFMSLWVYLSFHLTLFVGDVDKRTIQHTVLRAAPPPILYALTAALAFVNAKVCYVLWVLATLYVAVGPAARKIPVWAEVASETVGEEN
ncbi:MAG: TMEM175 family protein [Acidimicrobiales bacterium]|jgi:uncharacterized membrane protein